MGGASGGLAAGSIFSTGGFYKLKTPEDLKMQKYSKYEKQGGMPKRKKFFGQKNHPKPLMFVEIL